MRNWPPMWKQPYFSSSTTANSPPKRTRSHSRSSSQASTITSRRKSTKNTTMAVDTGSIESSVNGQLKERRPKSPRETSAKSETTNGKHKPAHKVDNSGKFFFGGTPGTLSMMIFFPILMYYLWICTTYYGGRLEGKMASETWLAFADRMIAHITRVRPIVPLNCN
jgi:hypothetical protein